MAKQLKVTVNGMEFTLQSVSPSWYMDTNDRHGMTGGKKQSAKYMDEMFKNCVIAPADVAARGMAHFDETEDLQTAVELLGEIEQFLYKRK